MSNMRLTQNSQKATMSQMEVSQMEAKNREA